MYVFLTLFLIWIALNRVRYPGKSGNKMVTLLFAHDALTVLESRIYLVCEIITIFDCKQQIPAVSEKDGLEQL